MEPVASDRNDGSQILVPLSCEDAALCERSSGPLRGGPLYVGVKVLMQALTCVRALPGDRVTTSALARPGPLSWLYTSCC